MSSSESESPKNPRIIALFDVDGTLTIPRGEITPTMMDFMVKLKQQITVGIVGGSDLPKQEEQLGEGVIHMFPYNFSQNGLVAYKNGQMLQVQTLSNFLGEANVKRIVNWTLAYLSQMDIPVKRGTFIEFRSGMLNISPIGRNCSREERNDFEAYDHMHHIRSTMVTAMKKEFADLNLTYSIGGQISFDVFPQGWDKTYCLKFLNPDEFDEIHFFGDKTFPGGNDYEIFTHGRVMGHTTTGPEDTIAQCTALFGL
jgi:phosphomannomutase